LLLDKHIFVSICVCAALAQVVLVQPYSVLGPAYNPLSRRKVAWQQYTIRQLRNTK